MDLNHFKLSIKLNIILPNPSTIIINNIKRTKTSVKNKDFILLYIMPLLLILNKTLLDNIIECAPLLAIKNPNATNHGLKVSLSTLLNTECKISSTLLGSIISKKFLISAVDNENFEHNAATSAIIGTHDKTIYYAKLPGKTLIAGVINMS